MGNLPVSVNDKSRMGDDGQGQRSVKRPCQHSPHYTSRHTHHISSQTRSLLTCNNAVGEMASPRKTRSQGPAEDIDLEHPAGGAEADALLIGVHPPTRLEKEVSTNSYKRGLQAPQQARSSCVDDIVVAEANTCSSHSTAHTTVMRPTRQSTLSLYPLCACTVSP